MESTLFYGVLFLFLTGVQSVLFISIDASFTVGMLLYRNGLFYLCSVLVSLFVEVGAQSSRLLRVSCIYLLWVYFYYVAIAMPHSIINTINVFTLLVKIDGAAIIRYTCFIVGLIVYCLLCISNKKEYINKWMN